MPDIKTERGINWNYDIDGKGEVLLFIHGWGVNMRVWRQQYKYFVEKYRVMTIDLPGHGKTNWKKVSLEDIADDIYSILDSLNINEITIVGSSLGGLVSLKMFQARPERIKRMIFIGSHPKFAKSDDYPYGLDVKNIRKLERQLKTDYPAILAGINKMSSPFWTLYSLNGLLSSNVIPP